MDTTCQFSTRNFEKPNGRSPRDRPPITRNLDAPLHVEAGDFIGLYVHDCGYNLPPSPFLSLFRSTSLFVSLFLFLSASFSPSLCHYLSLTLLISLPPLPLCLSPLLSLSSHFPHHSVSACLSPSPHLSFSTSLFPSFPPPTLSFFPQRSSQAARRF